ncbi:hypothetical protein D3C76_978780 [compost metagenome]
MLYIWPWMVPELPPQALTSSRITEASARPRPEPPNSSGIIADSQPASVIALTKASGKPFSSSILRQYSAGNSLQSARTPSRMADSSSLSYSVISCSPESGRAGRLIVVACRPNPKRGQVGWKPSAARKRFFM